FTPGPLPSRRRLFPGRSGFSRDRRPAQRCTTAGRSLVAAEAAPAARVAGPGRVGSFMNPSSVHLPAAIRAKLSAAPMQTVQDFLMTFAKRCLFAMLALLLPFAAAAQQQGLEIDIIGGNASALPIAVVPMPYQGTGSPPQTDVAGVVRADLERSGQFRTLPESD